MSFVKISLFIYILVSNLFAQSSIRLSEERPIGHEIDITHYLTSLASSNDELAILNQQSKGVSSFKIVKDQSKVKLIITSRIDRESLCPNSQKRFYSIFSVINGNFPVISNSFEDPCLIAIKVSSGEKLESIVIEILDINDNAPIWPITGTNPRYTHRINFKDDDPVGTEIILPLAEDADIVENAQITYSINSNDVNYFDISWTDFFTLDKIQGTENKESQLVLRSKVLLDREIYPKGWKLILVATDNGQPDRKSSRLPIEILINDLNDNAPQFSKLEYMNTEIQESASLNEVLVKVEATDPDLGKNGMIKYSIETNDENLKSYIEINESGEIRLRKRLQVDQVGDDLPLTKLPISFKVKASDMADEPYSLSSEVTVTIKINDINDERPTIQIHPLKPKSITDVPQSSQSEKIQLFLEENKSNALIALIQISDPDFEGKDIVTCSLHGINEREFQLDKTSLHNEFKLKSTRAWDREENSSIELFIKCQDSVSHTIQKQLYIKILDVNDNQPKFEKDLFKFKIKEDDGERNQQSMYFHDSSKRNKPWLTDTGKAFVSATDADEPMNLNSKLRYSIRPKPGFEGLHTEDLFQIDSETGALYVKGLLDRELQQYHSFMVHVEDLGDEPKSSIVQVDVELVDINDNPPTFTMSDNSENSLNGFSFSVEENSQIGSIVGTLRGIDPDISPELNLAINDSRSLPKMDSLYFALEKCKDSENFRVDPKTGQISIKRYLDREKRSMYSFKAYILDGQSKYQRMKSLDPEASLREEIDIEPSYRVHIVSTNIFITILDVNDNVPKFIQPNFTDHLVFVDPKAQSGTKILKIEAVDPDEGLNGKVTYKLLDGTSPPNQFSIHSHNGELYLENPFSNEMIDKAKRIFEEASMQKSMNVEKKKFFSQLDEAYPMFMLKLEACDLGEIPKCTTFPNLQIQLKFPMLEEEDPGFSNGPSNFGHSTFWSANRFGGRSFSENLAIGLSIFFSIVVILIAIMICFIRLRSRSIYRDENQQFKYVSTPHSQTLLLKDPNKFPIVRTTTDQLMSPYESIIQTSSDMNTHLRGQPNILYDKDNFMTINTRIGNQNRVVTLMKANGFPLQNYKQNQPYLQKTPTSSRQNSNSVPINYDSLRSQKILDTSQYNEYQTIPIKLGSNDDILSQTNLSEETMSCGSIEVSNINKNSNFQKNVNYSEKTELKPGEPLPSNLVLPKSTFV